MNELVRIQTLLASAAADGTTPSSQREPKSTKDGAAHIIARIGSTLLARRVDVKFEDGTRISFEAGERRLRRFTSPAPAELPPNQAALFDGAGLEASAAITVAEMLRTLFNPGTAFEVETTQLNGDPDLAPGISYQALQEILTGETETSDQKDASLEAFYEAVAPLLGASVLIGGDGSHSFLKSDAGEGDALLNWIEDLGDTLLSPDFPLFPTLETRGILMLTSRDLGGPQTLLAGYLGSFLAATTSAEHVQTVLSKWRAQID